MGGDRLFQALKSQVDNKNILELAGPEACGTEVMEFDNMSCAYSTWRQVFSFYIDQLFHPNSDTRRGRRTLST